MVTVTRRHSADEEVQLQGLRLIRHMSLLAEARDAIAALAITTLRTALKAHPNSRVIQTEGMSVVCNLCSKSNANRRAMVGAGIHEHVMSALERWPRDMNMKLTGCRAIQVR